VTFKREAVTDHKKSLKELGKGSWESEHGKEEKQTRKKKPTHPGEVPRKGGNRKQSGGEKKRGSKSLRKEGDRAMYSRNYCKSGLCPEVN